MRTFKTVQPFSSKQSQDCSHLSLQSRQYTIIVVFRSLHSKHSAFHGNSFAQVLKLINFCKCNYDNNKSFSFFLDFWLSEKFLQVFVAYFVLIDDVSKFTNASIIKCKWYECKYIKCHEKGLGIHFKGATKSYFTHYLCVVIILYNTGFFKFVLSTYYFKREAKFHISKKYTVLLNPQCNSTNYILLERAFFPE